MIKVYFVISTQHLIRAGGIGSFFKGFARMAQQLNWHVICVLDKKPGNLSQPLMDVVSGVEYIWTSDALSYAKPPDSSQFDKENVSAEKIENFRRSLNVARQQHEPDLILINTPEATDAAMATGQSLPAGRVLFYTHHENAFYQGKKKGWDKFSPAYDAFLNNLIRLPGLTIATQSQHNLDQLLAKHPGISGVVLPMPLPDLEVLSGVPAKPPEGVLFIGRHEQRKASADFAKYIAKTGFPAKVLTNKKGAASFVKTLTKAGVAQFDIQYDLSGQAKANFIASAKIAFHPSWSESYGFCAMETLAAGLPTLCLDRGWWQNFADAGVQVSSTRQATEKLASLYSSAPNSTVDWWQREQQTISTWRSLLPTTVPYEHVSDTRAQYEADFDRPQYPAHDYTDSPSLQNVALYLPAMSPTVVQAIDGPTRTIWGEITNKDLQFTRPHGKLFYYPWCLYSAGQAAKTAAMAQKDNWLTRAKIDPNVTVLGDSGGFQVQQGTIKFKPDTTERMLRWMERIATHSMTLDFPTGGISLGSLVPHIDRLDTAGYTIAADAKKHGFSTGFMACLIQSEINLQEFQRLRVPGATKLLNVIQGRNDRESQFWYDRVKGYNLEGWAFAGNHHTQLSMTLRRLIEMQKDGHLARTKWIHFLGISTLRAGVALTYLQRAMRRHNLGAADIQLSFDSSSPTQAAAQGYQAIIGCELSPEKWTFRPKRIALEGYIGTQATIQSLARDWNYYRSDRHSAHTFVGANIPIKDLITARPGKLPTQKPEQLALLVHHNTQAYIEAFRSVYSLLESKSATERPAPLKHFELLLGSVLELASKGDWTGALARVDEAANDLDVFMYEAQ
mgnify:CR=1 FL=1